MQSELPEPVKTASPEEEACLPSVPSGPAAAPMPRPLRAQRAPFFSPQVGDQHPTPGVPEEPDGQLPPQPHQQPKGPLRAFLTDSKVALGWGPTADLGRQGWACVPPWATCFLPGCTAGSQQGGHNGLDPRQILRGRKLFFVDREIRTGYL